MESRLTFIEKTKSGKGLYICACGNKKEVRIAHVNYGNRKTCGCGIGHIRTGGATHGLRKHKLYRTWAGIKDRCLNANTPMYKFYGALGVTMCDEWINDFKPFYDWCIANGWVEGMEVDKDLKPSQQNISARIYSPEMCSIISKVENNKYRKSTVFITRGEQTKCISDWCKEFRISPALYRLRIKKGWDTESSLTTPLKRKKHI